MSDPSTVGHKDATPSIDSARVMVRAGVKAKQQLARHVEHRHTRHKQDGVGPERQDRVTPSAVYSPYVWPRVFGTTARALVNGSLSAPSLSYATNPVGSP